MNDGGRATLLASSSAAPFDDKLRTVHSTSLPSNAILPPFSTLCRCAVLFSVVFSVIAVVRITPFSLRGYHGGDFGLINPASSIAACGFIIGLRRCVALLSRRRQARGFTASQRRSRPSPPACCRTRSTR